MSGRVWLLLVCVGVCVVSVSADCPDASGIVNNTASTIFDVSAIVGCINVVVKQNNVTYYAPDLRLVANTTVTFQLTSTIGVLGFGLSLSSPTITQGDGDFLGLNASASSGSACIVYPNSLLINNTIAHDSTITQPCNVTWTVPDTNTTYYYFLVDYSGAPRRFFAQGGRISVVRASDNPSSPSSSSSSSSSSSTGSSSSSSGTPTNSTGATNSTTTTAPPTATPTPTGSTPTPIVTAAPTSTPTPTTGPNGEASVTGASVVVAVVCVMLAVFGL